MDLVGSPGLDPGRATPICRLRELRDKYDQLIALRQDPPGRTAARRDAMRAVAERFPGALREWDALPLEELARRRSVIQALLDGETAPGSEEAWLPLWLDLHAHLRSLLRLRRWLRGRRERGAALCEEARRFHEAGAPPWREELTAERLGRIAAPPGGRLAELALADVAARHGRSIKGVKDILFSAPPNLDGR